MTGCVCVLKIARLFAAPDMPQLVLRWGEAATATAAIFK